MMLIEINQMVICTYFTAGALYLIYAFLIFIKRSINPGMRWGCSALFLTIGLFFMNEGGKLITEGVYAHLTFLAFIMSIVVSITGMVVVYILLNENSEKS